VRGESRESVIIRLKDNLPSRVDETTQTVFFTGKHACRWSTPWPTAATEGLAVQDLSLDGNRQNDPKVAMLGGIRFLNPVNCTISNVDISNVQGFGIHLHTFQEGPRGTNNRILNNRVHLVREWYLPGGRAVNPKSMIGIQLSSFLHESVNGAALHLGRLPDKYFPSRATGNLIEGNFVEGGSHAISMSNASDNILRRNTTTNSSHRGFILCGTCDGNLIEDNRCSDHGSTAIHLAYDCSRNAIRRNRVEGTRGGEGDGIKTYVNCNGNIIEENVVTDVAGAGIRVGHGANDNIIRNNVIACAKPWKADAIVPTCGIKVCAFLQAQKTLHFSADPARPAVLTANGNIVTGNKITGTTFGVVLTDDHRAPGSVRGNVIMANIIQKTFRGVHSMGVVGSQVDNVIAYNRFSENDWDVVTDFEKDNRVYANTRGGRE